MSSKRERCFWPPPISMQSGATIDAKPPARRSWACSCTAPATWRAPSGHCELRSACSTQRLRPCSPSSLRLTLAGIETVLGCADASWEELLQARVLYLLAPSLAGEIERSWSEARIAVAEGENDTAEALFERVRRELLDCGSLAKRRGAAASSS